VVKELNFQVVCVCVCVCVYIYIYIYTRKGSTGIAQLFH